MIRIEGLSYRFRESAQYALRDLSLEIEPGAFLVIGVYMALLNWLDARKKES